MTLFIQLLVVGLTSGAVYALIAIGYTMVYGIIELINFAHGDIFMIGTFITITVLQAFHIQDLPTFSWTLVLAMVVAFVASTVLCAILGVVIERIAYRPLRNAPRLAPLISAIGVSLALEDIGKLWKGLAPISPPQIFSKIYYIGPISIGLVDIVVIVSAAILMIALQWLVTRTRLGRAMRAVAQDREAAALMGVNVDRIISFTFLIGTGLAGSAGFIFLMKFPSTNFIIGFGLGLFAFTAAVLGGIGNIAGAMLGGLCIGLIQSLANIIPDSNDPASHGLGIPHGGGAWVEAIIFAILILILVFRPSGILGQQLPEKV
ncbi:MAG TPA: branched-chain amino acid ABC transporter permease [Ktedonobacteraceae bacterium]|nr:branched-chain amino acid ABC transporter permease [Ktedonobacteraceae bacterium]